MRADETFALLAPGDSLTQAQCDAVRGKCKVMAVADAYRLAPWADYLVANDSAWWLHRDTSGFKGKKFSANTNVNEAECIQPFEHLITRGSNSGVLALYIAAMILGAKRILLIGFDMKGTHFFGPHKGPLKNTTPERFHTFKSYFERMGKIMAKEGIECFNCTEGSALECFPRMRLEDAL